MILPLDAVKCYLRVLLICDLLDEKQTDEGISSIHVVGQTELGWERAKERTLSRKNVEFSRFCQSRQNLEKHWVLTTTENAMKYHNALCLSPQNIA